MSAFCQTCYTELPVPSTSASPRSRPRPAPYMTPCCNTPICDRCLSRNPRLREYVPCLRCGDVRTLAGTRRIKQGADEARRRREEQEAGVFTIGDDDEDDDGESDAPAAEAGLPAGDHGLGRSGDPPTYDQAISQSRDGSGGHPDEGPAPRTSGNNRPDDDDGPTGRCAAAASVEEEKKEIVEVKHVVGRNDTVLSIARKYAADPHDILSLNALPPTALSSNPRILQTRRSIVISRRLVPARLLARSASGTHDAPTSPGGGGGGAEDAVDPAEARRRERERQVKRFQLLTKTTDPAVGRAYLNLAEVAGQGGDDAANDGDEDILATGSGEALPRDDESSGDKAFERLETGGARAISGGKKAMLPRGPEAREERALEAFYSDEEWEGTAGQPPRAREGKWRSVGYRAPGIGVGVGVK